VRIPCARAALEHSFEGPGRGIVERLGLHPIKFELKHEIEFPGDPIDHLYFLEEGMASMTTTFKDGSQVE